MFLRDCKLPKEQSFFLFGARGTGKSSLLRERLAPLPGAYIDLLHVATERALSRDPDSLEARVRSLPPGVDTVVIDEIQKIPRLLDVVHRLIEEPTLSVRFAMTGSSARKLKAGGANLLAGRAFLRHLFPLTQREMREEFQLADALSWGTLPGVWKLKEESGKEEFLEAYANMYLKEEVWGEQIVRNLDAFRRFLEIAAAQNGSFVNASKIARDVGSDPKTVTNYYSVLEDTLLGFFLDPFHTSTRKRLRSSPKFYFFDAGVARALANHLKIVPHEGTSYFGQLFECFVMTEVFREISYRRLGARMSFLQTEAGVEIDLVLERPGKPLALVEIKSANLIQKEHVTSLLRFEADFPEAEFFCLSRDAVPKRWGRVQALPWAEGVSAILS